MEQQYFKYPYFVSNQVLSPDDLNNGISYLEEQERMTRVLLTGTGIVCGLQVYVDPDGSQLIIEGGCGITSEGYLIKVDTTTFNIALMLSNTQYNYSLFNSATVYELYNTTPPGDPNNPSVLVPSNTPASSILQLTSLLSPNLVPSPNMAVVLLYDLDSATALNCDTESCDGLGVTITANIRALLINKNSLPMICSAQPGVDLSANLFFTAPDISINRFNVTFNNICSTGDLFSAYQSSFSIAQLSSMQYAFSHIYCLLQPLIAEQYLNGDPLADFASNYAFLTDNTLLTTTNFNDLLQMQYYYDLFVNMIDAYNELLDACLKLAGSCCPPDNFPQHLMLGLITVNTYNQTDWAATPGYYTAFNPSAAVTGYSALVNRIITLYNRMAQMPSSFSLPKIASVSTQGQVSMSQIPLQTENDTDPVRITPTISGPAPLSKKTIPFYFNSGTSSIQLPLLQTWNYDLSVMGRYSRNLSYWASNYSKDQLITKPLYYDLERFNFLRVEGIIGMNYIDAMTALDTLRSRFRLPFDIVVTTTGSCVCQGGITSTTVTSPSATLAATQSALSASQVQSALGSGSLSSNTVEILGNTCTGQFDDLELAYNMAVAEMNCLFTNLSQLLYSLPNVVPATITTQAQQVAQSNANAVNYIQAGATVLSSVVNLVSTLASNSGSGSGSGSGNESGSGSGSGLSTQVLQAFKGTLDNIAGSVTPLNPANVNLTPTATPYWTDTTAIAPSKFPILKDYQVQPGTMGAVYEANVATYNASAPAPYQNPGASKTDVVQTKVATVTPATYKGVQNDIWTNTHLRAMQSVYIMQNMSNLTQSSLHDFVANADTFSSMHDDLKNLTSTLITQATSNQAAPLPIDNSQIQANLSDIQVLDLKTPLTKLTTLCKDAVMNEIVTEYNNRMNAIANSLTLSCFSQSYPGLQHRAGVPMGGTLVLVAHFPATSNNTGTMVLDATLNQVPSGTIVSDFFVEKYASCSVPQAQITVAVQDQKPFVSVSPAYFAVSTDKFGNVQSTGKIGLVTFGPAGVQSALAKNNTVTQSIAASVASSIAGAAVSAGGDSTLATLASANAAKYIMAGTNADDLATKLSADILKQGGLNANAVALAASIVARTSLSVNTMSGIPALMIEGNVVNTISDYLPSDFSTDYGPQPPNFDPSGYAPLAGSLSRAVQIAYTVNGITATTTAMVYVTPVASFVATQAAMGACDNTVVVKIDFSSSYNYETLSINFGDGSSTTVSCCEDPPVTYVEHTYNVGNGQTTFLVSLTAFNGTFTSVASQNITPIALPLTSN